MDGSVWAKKKKKKKQGEKKSAGKCCEVLSVLAALRRPPTGPTTSRGLPGKSPLGEHVGLI